VIVDTADAVLVAAKSAVQDVKKVVEQLKGDDRDECKVHRRTYRPWGSYDVVYGGDGFKVKHITVNPGQRLSLQMHHHRAEHWIVVRGIARVTKGDETFVVSENQSTYIPRRVRHRLENHGAVPLELIEVQTGSYLGEDDIVRFEDTYGRADPGRDQA
jgi:mannose-1-phosphate guanylyltransferase/mannose-6-phosphate isomerase